MIITIVLASCFFSASIFIIRNPVNAFVLDPRSLAVCRVLVGVTLLYEATIGFDWHTALAMLSDRGVWSRIDQLENGNQVFPSLLMAMGSDLWLKLFLTAFGLCSVAIILGYHARALSLCVFIIWHSILNRNWMMLHSFDDLTSVMVLWGVLGLSWTDKWSLDTRKDVKNTVEKHIPAILSCNFGLWVSVGSMYFLTGWWKDDRSWVDGSAVLLAIGTVHIQRPFGLWMCNSEFMSAILQEIGTTIRFVEFSAALILICPVNTFWGKLCRIGGIFALLLMHISIGLTMRLNAIGIINAAALSAFLPTEFWDTLCDTRVSCKLYSCLYPYYKFMHKFALTLDISFGINSTVEHDETFPIMKNISKFRKICNYMLQLFVVSFYVFSTVGGEVTKELFRIDNINVSKSVGHIFNNSYVQDAHSIFKTTGNILRLQQRYNVFSPRPPTQTWWLMFPAVLRNGYKIDIFQATRGVPKNPPFDKLPSHLVDSDDINYDVCTDPDLDPRVKPPEAFGTYLLYDERWGKYFESVVMGWDDLPEQSTQREFERKQQERLRLKLGRWICRSWNAVHGNTDFEVRNFTFNIYIKPQLKHDCPVKIGRDAHNISENTFWMHTCF